MMLTLVDFNEFFCEYSLDEKQITRFRNVCFLIIYCGHIANSVTVYFFVVDSLIMYSGR